MLARRSSDREAQRLGFRVEPDTFAFSFADPAGPAPAWEGPAPRRLVVGRDAVTIPPPGLVRDAEPGLDGEDALADAALEALGEDGVLALSRLVAIGPGAIEPF